MYPVYYDHLCIIVGNPTLKNNDGRYGVNKAVADIIAAGAPSRPVYIINPEADLIAGLNEAGIRFVSHQSKQPRYAHSCAWYMPVLHQLQGRPWTEERIEKFFV